MKFQNEVIHDDCMNVFQQLDDESIDLIVTDMPYGINFKSNSQNYNRRTGVTFKVDRQEYFNKIVNDNVLFVDWVPQAFRVLKNNAAIYIFCHWSKWHLMHFAVESSGFKIKNMIILNKTNHGMGDLKGSYAPKHELILFATKGRHIMNFPEKRLTDIWTATIKYSGSKRFHPNEKPTTWLRPCIENSSKEGDVVFDPFCGSGSTGIVCKNLKRNYIMCDIDEKFCKISRDRLL